jgi:hypothetical protein
MVYAQHVMHHTLYIRMHWSQIALLAFYISLLFVTLLVLFSCTPYLYIVLFKVAFLCAFNYSLKLFAIYLILPRVYF